MRSTLLFFFGFFQFSLQPQDFGFQLVVFPFERIRRFIYLIKARRFVENSSRYFERPCSVEPSEETLL